MRRFYLVYSFLIGFGNLFAQTYLGGGNASNISVTASSTYSDTIWMDALNDKGDPISVELSGIDAIVCQHEYDHLHGITMYDRLPNVSKQIHAKKFSKLRKAFK